MDTLEITRENESAAYRLDPATLTLWVGESRSLPLTPACFGLLQILHEANGVAVAREEIARRLNTHRGGVGSLVYKIRERVSCVQAHGWVVAVLGQGYKLVPFQFAPPLAESDNRKPAEVVCMDGMPLPERVNFLLGKQYPIQEVARQLSISHAMVNRLRVDADPPRNGMQERMSGVRISGLPQLDSLMFSAD